MREQDRIARFFSPLTAGEPGSFSLTDDAAVLIPPPKQKLVVTTDSVIVGTHVMADASAAQIATKLMRRNLSDLAAMGATPWRYSLNLHTPPDTADAWVAAFTETLAVEQKQFDITLIGGDSTSGVGPIMATMTCFGLLDAAAMLRSNARAGDVLYVSGTIGDAALGLAIRQGTLQAESHDAQFLTERYNAPTPRLEAGKHLARLAHAAMDVSDGLLADTQKLAAASNVRIMIEREAVPLSPAARTLVNKNPALWETILAGGDDYELLFTAPWSAMEAISTLAKKLAIPLTRIGSVSAGKGIELRDARGNEIPVTHYGYEH